MTSRESARPASPSIPLHRLPLVLVALALAISACTVTPPAEPGPESLVDPSDPVFDKRLKGIQRNQMDLSRFWSEIPAAERTAPVPLHHRTYAQIAGGAKEGIVNIYTRRVVERELLVGIHPNDLLPIRLPIVSPILDIIPFQVPLPFRDEGFSLGSGFVVNPEGFILTNAHVIQNATDVRVLMSSDRREYVARIVGSDLVTDTALIRVDAAAPLTPLPLGDSDVLEVGELVIAVGNPLGLGHTVTSGLVSATERLVPGDEEQLLDYLQTDSAINPGSSGGPLLNLHGEVVGINTAIVSDAQLIGFAIPINIVKAVLPLLIMGESERGWLGITALPLEPAPAPAAGEGADRGVRIEKVESKSPAESAGLRAGDLIVGVNGREIRDLIALRRASLTFLPGDEVHFAIQRDGRRLDALCTLAHRQR